MRQSIFLFYGICPLWKSRNQNQLVVDSSPNSDSCFLEFSSVSLIIDKTVEKKNFTWSNLYLFSFEDPMSSGVLLSLFMILILILKSCIISIISNSEATSKWIGVFPLLSFWLIRRVSDLHPNMNLITWVLLFSIATCRMLLLYYWAFGYKNFHCFTVAPRRCDMNCCGGYFISFHYLVSNGAVFI